MSPAALQADSSIGTLLNILETETLALFEHLFFKFLEEFNVFAPPPPREHEIKTI